MSHQFNHRPCFRIFDNQKRQPHTPKAIVREPQVRVAKTSTRIEAHVRHEAEPAIADQRIKCSVCDKAGGTLVATEQGYKHQKCKKGI